MVIGLQPRTNSYPGSFSPSVEATIRPLAKGRVLHLFSGQSLIGDERVDIERPEATINDDVARFITTDTRDWDWVILDPPYGITRCGSKLAQYGIKEAVSGNVGFRRLLMSYFRAHTDNVLWLDHCAPVFRGFRRRQLWLCLPGGFETVRVLSWLERVRTIQEVMPIDDDGARSKEGVRE